jgi:hypothetical protein
LGSLAGIACAAAAGPALVNYVDVARTMGLTQSNVYGNSSSTARD